MHRRVVGSTVAVLVVLLTKGAGADSGGGAPAADGLKPGETLNSSTWQKAVWNFFYRTYYFGNLRAESQLNMMNPSSVERRLDVDVRFMYYDGVPEEERLKENPQNFLYQQLVVVESPNDVQGTGSLSWR